jgi:nicotinamide-nucleotide amidase
MDVSDTESSGRDLSEIESRIHTLLAATEGAPTALKLATAESCTGGGVAARITSVAGASEYFLGGIVAYANDAKVKLLGVSPDTLATQGAVSAACAREMAEGARRALGSDLAVSTTGIAGPGGATARKPVGLVYIALADPNGVQAEEFYFPGGRAVITDAATEAALLMLVRGIERVMGDG